MKVSGTLNDGARILVIEESGWTLESNSVETPASFEITGLASGDKLIIARSNDGEIAAYGGVEAVAE